MAANKFKPKASSNILEGVTPVEESTVTPAQEETAPEVPATSVTFEDKDTKVPAPKNVKVCLKTNHTCTVGGVTYHFVKGKQTSVPLEVKNILLKADLLMPL